MDAFREAEANLDALADEMGDTVLKQNIAKLDEAREAFDESVFATFSPLEAGD